MDTIRQHARTRAPTMDCCKCSNARVFLSGFTPKHAAILTAHAHAHERTHTRTHTPHTQPTRARGRARTHHGLLQVRWCAGVGLAHENGHRTARVAGSAGPPLHAVQHIAVPLACDAGLRAQSRGGTHACTTKWYTGCGCGTRCSSCLCTMQAHWGHSTAQHTAHT